MVPSHGDTQVFHNTSANQKSWKHSKSVPHFEAIQVGFLSTGGYLLIDTESLVWFAPAEEDGDVAGLELAQTESFAGTG